MTAAGRAHDRRDRAESFGADAEAYDRARPDYPGELLDDLLDGVGLAVDVGCGTGQLAARIAARGVEVIGVEVDARMAEVARAKGLRVDVSPFETWPGPGRAVDLIVCGQAWHWVRPEEGARRAADLLRPGGRLALAWNWSEPDQQMQQALDRAYAVAPSLGEGSILRGGGPGTIPLTIRQLRDAQVFADVSLRQYHRSISYTAARWVELIGTHSDHRSLPPAELHALKDAVGRELSVLGDPFEVAYTTEVVVATTP